MVYRLVHARLWIWRAWVRLPVFTLCFVSSIHCGVMAGGSVSHRPAGRRLVEVTFVIEQTDVAIMDVRTREAAR